MSDLISREAAINAVLELCKKCDSCHCGDCLVYAPDTYIYDVIDLLTALPAAEKVGKWTEFESDEDKYDIIKCSCCKHTFTVDSCHWTDIGFVKDDFNFCPNCGARMEGEEG